MTRVSPVCGTQCPDHRRFEELSKSTRWGPGPAWEARQGRGPGSRQLQNHHGAHCHDGGVSSTHASCSHVRTHLSGLLHSFCSLNAGRHVAYSSALCVCVSLKLDGEAEPSAMCPSPLTVKNNLVIAIVTKVVRGRKSEVDAQMCCGLRAGGSHEHLRNGRKPPLPSVKCISLSSIPLRYEQPKCDNTARAHPTRTRDLYKGRQLQGE